MSICRNCGVETGDAARCPLCQHPVGADPDSTVSPRSDAELQRRSGGDRATLRNAKLWLFEMISLISFTAAIVIFAADFAFGFAVTWSVYPLAVIIFAWLAASALVGLFRFPIGLVIAETILVVGFLLALSVVTGGSEWFLSLALPITALAGVVTGIIIIVARLSRASALQAVGVGFLGVGFFLVGLELVLNNHLDREAPVSWSLVAFACSVSLFFLMLFINKRLREHHSEFRRIFHI